MQRPRSAAADPGELAARFFRALYQAETSTRSTASMSRCRRGTPCFADRSLGASPADRPAPRPARQGSRPPRQPCDPMTTGGAPRSPPGVLDVDGDRAAEAFRVVWGQAYDIAFTVGAWRACRPDENRDPHHGQDTRWADRGDPRLGPPERPVTAAPARLSLMPDELDQVLRLNRYRRDHPRRHRLRRARLLASPDTRTTARPSSPATSSGPAGQARHPPPARRKAARRRRGGAGNPTRR